MSEVIDDKALPMSYRFIKELGLPTFFAVILLGLVMYQARLQTQMEIDFTKSNQVKIDKLDAIITNQQRIISAEERMETKFNLEWDSEKTRDNQQDQVDNEELSILRRLDSIFLTQRGKR